MHPVWDGSFRDKFIVTKKFENLPTLVLPYCPALLFFSLLLIVIYCEQINDDDDDLVYFGLYRRRSSQYVGGIALNFSVWCVPVGAWKLWY